LNKYLHHLLNSNMHSAQLCATEVIHVANSTLSTFQNKILCNLFTKPLHLTDAETFVVFEVSTRSCTNFNASPLVFCHNFELIKKFRKGGVHITHCSRVKMMGEEA